MTRSICSKWKQASSNVQDSAEIVEKKRVNSFSCASERQESWQEEEIHDFGMVPTDAFKKGEAW